MIKDTVKALIQNLKGINQLSPVYIVFLLNFWMLTNAPALVGEGSTEVRWMIMMYMSMLIGGIALAPTKPSLVNGDITQVFNFFWIFFASSVMFALSAALPGLGEILSFQTFSITGGIGGILLQAFTVAFSEEFFFRGVLEEVTGSKLIANGLFGPWHWATYGGSWTRILIASVMGMFFSAIKDKFTLLGSMGAHTAWNLKAMGELSKFVGLS